MASMFTTQAVKKIFKLIEQIADADIDERVDAINQIKRRLHEVSPMKDEPVDCVLWVKSDTVTANEYNPNKVAQPEMKLLEISITEDGYTQPVVSWLRDDAMREVVDGFHRHRVGKESETVRERVHGYLPVVTINDSRLDKTDRIASTIRHNRARGKHQVGAMSDIVVELKRRNWSDEKISRELGMESDEVLRLCQISGLAELFSDQEFSKSWDVEGEVTESDFRELTDDVSTYGEETTGFRTVNTSDETRIFHTYEKWECYKAKFYDNFKEGMTKKECEDAFARFLCDIPKFTEALKNVIFKWKHSCEHYLTNSAMNRIAWLGQAAVCYGIGIPSAFRSGYFLISPEERKAADQVALRVLNKWLKSNGLKTVTMEVANSGSRQSDIY